MKLSFVIPVYNVAPYLRKCVDSLLVQDYADYEMILVDDGSTDGSAQICDQIVESQESRVKSDGCSDSNPFTSSPTIKVIHQANAGLSAARNSGLAIAQGEYICFVDSDDYWQPNMLGALMAQIEQDNLDVLRFRLQYVRIVESGKSRVEREYEIYNPYKSDPFAGNDYSAEPTDGITFLNQRMNTQCYAWTFIIKHSLIVDSQESKVKSDNHTPYTVHSTPYTDTLFTEGIYFEDTDWTPRMLVKAQRVASADRVVYNYLLTRQGSITNAPNRAKLQKVLDDKMRLVGELQRQSSALLAQGKDNRWYGRMIAALVISIFGILSADFYNERMSYLQQLKEWGVYPLQSNLPKARLINLSPYIAVWLLYIKN